MNLSTVDQALKEFYFPALRESLGMPPLGEPIGSPRWCEWKKGQIRHRKWLRSDLLQLTPEQWKEKESLRVLAGKARHAIKQLERELHLKIYVDYIENQNWED